MHLDREDAVAARVEEVVLNADRRGAERLAPDRQDRVFRVVLGALDRLGNNVGFAFTNKMPKRIL